MLRATPGYQRVLVHSILDSCRPISTKWVPQVPKFKYYESFLCNFDALQMIIQRLQDGGLIILDLLLTVQYCGHPSLDLNAKFIPRQLLKIFSFKELRNFIKELNIGSGLINRVISFGQICKRKFKRIGIKRRKMGKISQVIDSQSFNEICYKIGKDCDCD